MKWAIFGIITLWFAVSFATTAHTQPTWKVWPCQTQECVVSVLNTSNSPAEVKIVPIEQNGCVPMSYCPQVTFLVFIRQ